MATPVEIVKEKSKEIMVLWTSKRMKELVTTCYASDACVSDNGVFYNGHDEILKACENLQDVKFEMTLVDASSPSDDCVIQTYACKWDGKDRDCKLTWKKIDDDWKITREEWN
ncbi:unnamed protein product [Rotaria sp. Silwood2]|nr:unnamed protein product [Rotaria sp. Silwood2]CAF2936227.1 unnamed protein product [Rotaria sp. Silwood2]CAF4299986.1 unnamed protein product [Rotaria sp. Silwood2]CAF4306726.1 unnamed protein product [Rotaria sp. Silwood2]CAF4462442.1 unnamed protein product [Rotaria sp. Silwood2]